MVGAGYLFNRWNRHEKQKCLPTLFGKSSMAAPQPSSARQTMPAQARRDQLILATIKCIATKGLSGTTMVDITTEAGLSLGIVNLHFKSKEKLLVDTLRYISDEYTSGLDKIFNDPSKTTKEKIITWVSYDFSRKITDRNKLAVWFAFWGETKSRPTYLAICANYINDIAGNLTQLFTQLKHEGNYEQVNPILVCNCYTAMADGLWLDLLITPKGLTPDQARGVTMHYLATQFPNHFTA